MSNWRNFVTVTPLLPIPITIYQQKSLTLYFISIRYEEIVTTASGYPLILDSPSTEYPFSQTFVQHEHALVTVEGDCKISLWDQYGDDMEQVDVETAAADLFKAYIFGLLSPEKMSDPLNHDMRSIYLP